MLALARQCAVRAALRPRRILLNSHNVLPRDFASADSKWSVMNEDITAPFVNIVDNDGKMRTNIPINEAIEDAESQGVDLVQVSPEGKVPVVCKLFDAKKRLYELKKASKRMSKQHKPKPDKEVVISSKIAPNDLNMKVDQLKRFLKKGHKVKVTMKYMYDPTNQSKLYALDQLKQIESRIDGDMGVVNGLPSEQHGAVYVFFAPVT